MTYDHCIYCESADFSGEHYLPVVLGQFKGNTKLKGTICRECNSEIGAAAEKCMYRSRFVAGRLKLNMIDDERLKKVFYNDCHGQSPLVAKAYNEEFGCKVEFDCFGGNEAFLARQIIIEYTNGKRRAVRILDRHEHDFSEILTDLGDTPKVYAIICRPEELEWIRKITFAIDAQFDAQKLKYNPDPNEGDEYRLTIRLPEDNATPRTIAAIAFHNALWAFDDLDGTHANFQNIREFVRHGEGSSFPVSQSPELLSREFEDGMTTKEWCHLLMCERGGHRKRISVTVGLFVGPDNSHDRFDVDIGPDPSRVVYPIPQSVGHLYRFHEESARKPGEDGEMFELTPTIAPLIAANKFSRHEPESS